MHTSTECWDDCEALKLEVSEPRQVRVGRHWSATLERRDILARLATGATQDFDGKKRTRNRALCRVGISRSSNHPPILVSTSNQHLNSANASGSVLHLLNSQAQRLKEVPFRFFLNTRQVSAYNQACLPLNVSGMRKIVIEDDEAAAIRCHRLAISTGDH